MTLDSNQLMQRLIFILLGIAVGAGALALLRGTRPAAIQLEPAPATATPYPWQVYVSGAVHAPGVYPVTPGMIAQDAIRLAGGLTSDADEARINLALRLSDGVQLFVPTVGEEIIPLPTTPPISQSNIAPAQATAEPTAAGPINLNTATAADLTRLPGIGPATAENIISHRQQNGPFATIEDIMQVPGIGAGRFEEIKTLITVSNP